MSTDAEKTTENVASQAQEKADKEAEEGYIGVKADPEPNETYTVAGVTRKKKDKG